MLQLGPKDGPVRAQKCVYLVDDICHSGTSTADTMRAAKQNVSRCGHTHRLMTRNIARDIRVFDKGKQYNEVMQEKMQWTNSPFEYDFERGLYYHHILADELLCGSQPTNVDDVRYLREAEEVDVIVSVCCTLELSTWDMS